MEAGEDAPDEIIDVTNKEAIECLEKLQKYLNQENNISILFEQIRQLNSIKNTILNNINRRNWSSTFDFNVNNQKQMYSIS